MTLDWTDFPHAPAPGTVLCQFAAVAEGALLSLELNGFPVLVIARDGVVHAYVNACPHQFLPLDLRGADILSADGAHLLCTNHTAMFRIETGAGVAGEGLGCALSLIPVVVEGENVVIAG